jgi:hypothetical protein
MSSFQAGRTEGGLKDCGAKLDIVLTIFRYTSTGFIPDYREAIVDRNTNRTNFEKDGHMRQARYRFFLLPLFFVLACVGAFAQANSEVTGIVTDQTGAVIPDAKIVLTDPANGFTRETASGPTGLFVISGLNPSNYNLKVSAKGFQAFAQTGIVVNVSGTFRVDVKLTLGSESQTITVEADALAVQTDSNVISTLITGEVITSIATENRNFSSLAALGLGVSSKLGDSSQSLGAFGSDWSIQFNGLREAHNIWLIDGGESADRGGGGGMQILPSQDAIAEFQMMTSNYPPDYGISSGATISLSLKTGTKNFHGSAYEENRATAYNANTWNNKNSGQDRVATHYNVYGFNVGGPIYIPHTYNTNKNKAFFFFNQEWRKTSSVGTSDNATLPKADIPTAGTNLTYVDPTYADKKGAGFTWLQVPAVPSNSYYQTHNLGTLTAGGCFQGTKALDPVSGKYLCPVGQIIPATLFDSNAVTYLKAGILPAPNYSDGTDYNHASVPLPQKVTDTVIRGDYNFNDKWALLVHYIQDHQNQNYGKPELGWCGCDYNTLTSILSSPAHSATVKVTGAINSNLLVEASINYDGNGADILPSDNSYLPGTTQNPTGSWTVSPVVAAYTVQRHVWPNMTWGNTLGGGKQEQTATEPYHNAAQDYAPKVDVSYTTGKHQLKFGLSYNRYTKNQMMYTAAQGSYGFDQLTGFTLIDTLLGLSNGYSQAKQPYTRHYYNQTPSAYAQDNWHITPRFSLQIGIRYDAMPHTVERQNLMGNFNQADYQTGAANAPIWNSDGSISASSPYLYSYNDGSGAIKSYINGTNLAGVNGFPRGVTKNDYKTLQPRIGFSEDLTGNGRTILRGGFGTFYERFQGNDVFDVATSAPFNPSLSLSNSFFSTPGTNWSTGNAVAPDSLIFAGSSKSVTPVFRAPAVAMYSLGVQHQISPSVIWVVQYIGNTQWHQNYLNSAVNDLPTNTGYVNIQSGTAGGTCAAKSTTAPFTCMDARQVSGDPSGKYSGDSYLVGGVATPVKVSFDNIAGMNAYRSYPGYADIVQDTNTATGNYNGLQTSLRIQNRWGLSGEVDYTYSHAIDVSFESADRKQIDNPWNLKYDKGSNYYDRRHIVNINYIYNLPFFNKNAGLLKSIAGGWQIAGTVVKQTGVPQHVNLNASYDPIGLGGGYQNHPNITAGGKLKYPKRVDQWFDTSRIDNNVTPVWAGGTNLGFGNWGKDTLVLPGRFNLTTSLYKNFQIYKEANFQIKVESFNTLNHTEWNDVDTTTGKIKGTNDPRNLQLAGKFSF